MTFVGLVRKNLFRKKLRTFLSAFAILVAFVLFGTLFAFNSALNAGVASSAADRLVVSNKVNFTLDLPIAYVERVKAVDGVELVTYSNWFGGFFQEPRNFMVAFAVDPATYLDINPEFILAPEQRASFLQDRTAIAVGKPLADRFGWKLGDRIPLSSNIWTKADDSNVWDFTVAAIFTANDPRVQTDFVFFHFEYFDDSRVQVNDTIGQIILRTRDPAENDRIIAEIDAMFANSANETRTQTEQAFAASFVNQLGDIGFIVTSVTAAGFLTILLIVGNTMVQSVRERTREIGVLKTMGFTSGRIFGLVLGESFLLAFIGGGLGLLLAAGFTAALGQTVTQFGPLAMTWDIAAFGAAIMALLGFVTGFLPALRAMRLSIVDALGRG